jgi:hypothetical protein
MGAVRNGGRQHRILSILCTPWLDYSPGSLRHANGYVLTRGGGRCDATDDEEIWTKKDCRYSLFLREHDGINGSTCGEPFLRESWLIT